MPTDFPNNRDLSIATAAIEQLAKAAELIGDSRLCKKMVAKKRLNGKVCLLSDPAARYFCVRGAIGRAAGNKIYVGCPSEQFVFRVLRFSGRSSFYKEMALIAWNNAEERTASEVSSVLLRASRLAKREAAKLRRQEAA